MSNDPLQLCGINTLQTSCSVSSPLGDILITADEQGLTGLWFSECKDASEESKTGELLPTLQETKRWLERYFKGEQPAFLPPMHLKGTPFQCEVWQLLQTIPYAQTVSYGQLAQTLAHRRGAAHMSAQAVGRAAAYNPILLLIPCHRVIGADGSLTGYAGGLERKRFLLDLEQKTK